MYIRKINAHATFKNGTRGRGIFGEFSYQWKLIRETRDF